MKKVTLWSIIATAGLFVINFLSAHIFGFIFSLDDGFYRSGFGVAYSPAYSSASGVPRPESIEFDFVSLLLTLFGVFFIGTVIYVIYMIIKLPKKLSIISLIITAGMFLANLLCGIFLDFLPFGIMLFGGEMYQMVGCGVNIVHFVPMTSIDDPVKSSTHINFEPFTLILTFVVVFFIALMIYRLNKRRAERKAAKAAAASAVEETADNDSQD